MLVAWCWVASGVACGSAEVTAVGASQPGALAPDGCPADLPPVPPTSALPPRSPALLQTEIRMLNALAQATPETARDRPILLLRIALECAELRRALGTADTMPPR